MKKRTGKMISLSLAVAMAMTAAPVTALADDNVQGSVIEANELTPVQSTGETGTDTTTVDTNEEEGTAWAELTPAEKVGEEEALNALSTEDAVEEEVEDAQESKITVNGVAVDSLAEAFAKANSDTITTSITIKIPEGKFYATDNEQLKITRNNVFIEGAGQDKTIIDCGDYSCSGQGGILIASEHVYISDLTVLSSANPDNKGNVAAIKATDLSSPSKILDDIYIERVAVSSEFGHGLNLHGTDATVDGLIVENAGKCGISLANTNAIVRNTSIKDTVWGDIGMMYADNDNYKNPVKLILGENNNIDLIYSERTTSDKHDFIRFMANYDGIVFCKPDVEIDYTVDAGVNKPTIIYSGKAAYIEGKEGTTYETVQDAINDAVSGDTIIVMNGVHKENITIPADKALTLEGESKNAVIQFDVATKKSVVQGTTTYYPIVYAQSNATIRNLTIEGPTDQHHGIDGVLATADLTMENVTIQDIRCTADGADYCGVQYGKGIVVIGDGNVDITDCTIERFQKNAIDLNTTGTQTITETKITGAGPQAIIGQNGIVIRQGEATISDTEISDLVYNADNEWAYCSSAIYPLDGTTLNLTNNTISNTDSGIVMNDNATINGADTTQYDGGVYVNGSWCSVDAALTYLAENDNIKLNQDITLPVTIDENNVTIDGAGYSITVESGDALTVTGDYVTLNNVKAESKNGIALVAGSSSDSVAGITVNGGTYKTGTEVTGKQGEGALRIYSSEKVTVKDVTTIGGIHLLATNNDYEITGNQIGFTYNGETPFVGILVMENTDSQKTAQSLVDNNTISLPNAGSDYAQIVTGNDWEDIEKVTGSTAKIGKVYYNTLDDAVKAANDGETITLITDCEEKITVSRAVTFTLETEDSAEFTGSITAGSGYRLNKDGNVYTFTKRTSSGGGSSHSYDGYITIINPKNGDVSVSDTWADEDQKITLTITPDKGYEVDKIEIVDDEGDKIDAKKVEDEDDKYTFRMANCDVTVTVTFKEEGTTTEDTDKEEDKDEETTELNFTDVKESDWFYKGVAYVVDKGIMSGVSENQFDPSGKLTRAMLVQMLYNMESRPACDAENAFIDVPVGQWYTDAVIWANDAKIVSGMGDGLFAPNMEITREQMVAMLYNYAKYKGYDVTASADLSKFADSASVSTWAQPAMQWAVAEGYISGMGDNQLAPQGTATRAEIASVIMRFMEATAESAETAE